MTIHAKPGAFTDPKIVDFQGLSLTSRLRRIPDLVGGPLVFTTSFGIEDQVLTSAILEAGIAVTFVTLDTGRLFDETLEVWAETEMRYGISIWAYMPSHVGVEALLQLHGPLGFRRSIEGRHACCDVRKVEPLGRALNGAAGWLTGIRAGQSRARAATPFLEHDQGYGLVKVSPLADWSRSDVEDYVRLNDVPYNPLHDRGFASIGCAPCTRAVRVGEDERAGRWWWENDGQKECGLHTQLPDPLVAGLRPARN